MLNPKVHLMSLFILANIAEYAVMRGIPFDLARRITIDDYRRVLIAIGDEQAGNGKVCNAET